MTRKRQWWIPFIFLIAIGKSLAFENEPDGFREVVWGTAPGTVEGLHSGTKAAVELREESSGSMISAEELPLLTFKREGDKLEFGKAEISRISYEFYKDRFYRAVLYYHDSEHDWAGQRYSRMHELGEPPPRWYQAKKYVDEALKENFGRPTRQPNLLLQVATTLNKKVYKGPKTTIVSECSLPKPTECTLTFMSTSLDQEFQKDVKDITARQKKAWQSEQANKEAERKAKPDY